MTQKRWPILIILVVCLVLFSASLFSVVTFVSRPRVAPLTLLRMDYDPPGTVCPGDVVPFVLEWSVRRDSTLTLTPTHNRSHDGSGGNVVVAHYDDVVNLNQPATKSVVDDDLSFVVPDLPAGEYARILSVGTSSESSVPVLVTFPYTIGQGCDDSDN